MEALLPPIEHKSPHMLAYCDVPSVSIALSNVSARKNNPPVELIPV